MATVTNEQLAYISEHMRDCRKHNNKKYRMLIVADSNDSGKKLAQIFKAIYPNTEIKDYSGGYRDFSVVFDKVWRRDQAVNDVNAWVASYRNAHPELIDTSDTDDDYDDDSEDTDSGTTSGLTGILGGTTTYIIIGAIAIVLILLLWDKKK